MTCVAVLMGGISKEREISLKTGAAIANALEKLGHDVVALDVKGPEFIQTLIERKVAVAFIAMHGRYGEDGSVQGVLEWLKIPYTGSSVKVSALCFDKRMTKIFLDEFDVPTPKYRVFRKNDEVNSFIANFDISLPVIVKPNTEGSTIGISRVFKKEDLLAALLEALKFDQVVLVEQYIQGREVTVGVLDGKALPIIEVKPKGGFYDFASKYTKGATEYLVPAPLEEGLARKISEMSEVIYRSLECSGAVRADFMIDDSGDFYFLEVNTIPGMTETSLLPKAAMCQGITFENLCSQILNGASLKA